MSSNGFWHRIKHKFKGVGRKGRFDVPQVESSKQTNLVAFRRFGDDDLPPLGPASQRLDQGSCPSVQVTVNNKVPQVTQRKQDSKTTTLQNYKPSTADKQDDSSSTTLQNSGRPLVAREPVSNGITITVPRFDSDTPKQPLPSPPSGPSPIPPSRCSFSDEDPDYATLEEVKREQASIRGASSSSLVPAPLCEKSSNDSGYETTDFLLRVPETQSVPTSPVLLSDDASRRHLLSSPGMRNSVSDFPTYDNWQFKQRESNLRESLKLRNSLSEFPTYDNVEFRQDQNDKSTSPTKSSGSVEDLYATPPQKRKGGSKSRESFEESVNDELPPLPDRKYERSQSLLKVIEKQEKCMEDDEKNNESVLQQLPEASLSAENLNSNFPTDSVLTNEDDQLTNSNEEDTQQDSQCESVEVPEEIDSNMNNNSSNGVECQHPQEEPIHMSLEEVRQSRTKLQHDCSICQQAKQSDSSDFHTHTEHSPYPPETPQATRKRVSSTCIDALECLKDVGWYWGPLSSQEAEGKLDGKPDGAFLVRDSADEHYILSLSFRSSGQTHHTRIEHHKGHFSFYTQPESHGHDSIVEFIQKAMEHSRTHKFLYFMRPHAPGLPPFPVSLLFPFSRYQKMRSLQHMCRFLILKRVRRDHIELLPLPTKTKEYLAEAQYYIEDSEE